MVTLSQLKTFVLAAERQSFSTTARELGLSSAAVSKQLILLEKELGLELMVRTTRSVELTQMGKSYYEQCKRILEEVDISVSLVEQMKSIPRGVLKIVSGNYFANSHIVPHIREFLELFPNIQIHLELAERLPNLDEEAVDILIGMSLPATGNVIQRKIATTRCCFCASPAYLENFGVPQCPQDLFGHRHIIHSMRNPVNVLKFPNKEEIKLEPFFCVNDSKTMVKLAEQGLGIIKAHLSLVSELLQEKKLIEILPDFVDREIPLYVAFPHRRYVPSKVRHFIDFILSKL
ncbi:MAG: LysR family transcriptional regulator [Candidatus Protochlamydia sp.]|nr:LysR family transcriptional regulator [Candidatus Protochlamydia sp.]